MTTPATGIRQLLKRGESVLVEHGVPNAFRNVEWMLCDSLECSVLDLYTGFSGPGPPEWAGEIPTDVVNGTIKDYTIVLSSPNGPKTVYILASANLDSDPFLVDELDIVRPERA